MILSKEYVDMNSPVIEMRHIVKRFGNFVANDGINLTVHKGEIHAILGENGAGKSTLMTQLYGLLKPSSGDILVKGKKIDMNNPRDAIRAGIGMVHQHFMLIQPLTVTENIPLTDSIYRMTMTGEDLPEQQPGRIPEFSPLQELERLPYVLGIRQEGNLPVCERPVALGDVEQAHHSLVEVLAPERHSHGLQDAGTVGPVFAVVEGFGRNVQCIIDAGNQMVLHKAVEVYL